MAYVGGSALSDAVALLRYLRYFSGKRLTSMRVISPSLADGTKWLSTAAMTSALVRQCGIASRVAVIDTFLGAVLVVSSGAGSAGSLRARFWGGILV